MTDAQSDFTPNFALPYVLPAQAQKHVTINESLRTLDALTMATAVSRSTSAPPQEPEDGTAWLIPAGATGDWSADAGALAVWQDGAWAHHTPRAGWRMWIADENALIIFDGTEWSGLSADAITEFGVNTQPDPINRLAVKSDAVLLSHDDVTPGSGDMRLFVNKEALNDTASVVFQSGWSARGEIGLTGNDGLAVRLSADGATFTTALSFDPTDASIVAHTGLRIGGEDDSNRLGIVERGAWTPVLGSIKTGNFAGATGLAVDRANYLRIGDLVELDLVARVTGLTPQTFGMPTSLQINNLPFLPVDGPTGVDDGGVRGFVYQSVGSALNNLVGGGISRDGDGIIYLFVVIAAMGNATNTSRIYLKATYFTDDSA